MVSCGLVEGLLFRVAMVRSKLRGVAVRCLLRNYGVAALVVVEARVRSFHLLGLLGGRAFFGVAPL